MICVGTEPEGLAEASLPCKEADGGVRVELKALRILASSSEFKTIFEASEILILSGVEGEVRFLFASCPEVDKGSGMT